LLAIRRHEPTQAEGDRGLEIGGSNPVYSLNIVLIGGDESVLPHVRREALNHGATIDAEFSDLPSALNELGTNTDKSRLFIVYVDSGDELTQLKRLSSTFVGRPIIALVNPDKDGSMILKAMRAGALQVVILPLRREDFGAALDCIAVQFGLARGRAKTIAVAGATGGCGATTIALNLAYELAYLKQVNCILMELSLRMGVLASQLDVQPRYTTSDLLFDMDNVDSYAVNQALTRIADNFSILPGPYQTIEPGVIQAANVLKLIDFAGHLAEVVVLDVPCTFDELYFKSLSAADKVVLVTQQKVSSIRGAQMVCNALPDLRPALVVNRYDPKLSGFSADRLRSLLKCPELTTVANDTVVGAAADHGRPLRLQGPRSRVLADIGKLVEDLAPKEFEPKRRTECLTILGRLRRALSLT
jgi:pilus assembly protein CpaE